MNHHTHVLLSVSAVPVEFVITFGSFGFKSALHVYFSVPYKCNHLPIYEYSYHNNHKSPNCSASLRATGRHSEDLPDAHTEFQAQSNPLMLKFPFQSVVNILSVSSFRKILKLNKRMKRWPNAQKFHFACCCHCCRNHCIYPSSKELFFHHGMSEMSSFSHIEVTLQKMSACSEITESHHHMRNMGSLLL